MHCPRAQPPPSPQPSQAGPPLLEQPPGTGRGGTRRGQVGGLPGGLNPHLQNLLSVSCRGSGHGADEPVRAVEEGTFAVGHSRVPDRPLEEGGMGTDESMLAPGPWGVRAPSGTFHPERVLSWAFGLSCPCGASGRGCGCRRSPWQPPSSTAIAGVFPVELSLAHWAPTAPQGPCQSPGLLSPSWKSCSAGKMPAGTRVSQPGRSPLAAQGNGVAGEEVAGLRGAEQRAHRAGRGWLLPGSDFSPRLAGLVPKSRPGSPQAHRRQNPRLPVRQRAHSSRLCPRAGSGGPAGYYLEARFSGRLHGASWVVCRGRGWGPPRFGG